MEVKVFSGNLAGLRDQALTLTFFEGDATLKGIAKEMDSALGGAITRLLKNGDLTGKGGQVLVIYPGQGYQFERLVLVGLGKRDKVNLDQLRQAAGRAVSKAKELKLETVSFAFPENLPAKSNAADVAQAITEGALLGNYSMDLYKSPEKEKKIELKSFTLVDKDAKRKAALEKGKEWGDVTSWACSLARDWINLPGNALTPNKLAQEAKKYALKYDIKHQALTPGEIAKLKMGALLGVSRGSQEPCRFIMLEYKKGKAGEAPIVLVGKGVTFDSGGISIKPAEKMEEMKADMSGAAAAIAATLAAARMKLPVNLVTLVPATENLPSGTSLKPGDILTAMNGKTIEVVNTDAEGRLILADALAYAGKYKPKAVIDLATLTGSCIVALGHLRAGLLGNDKKLLDRIKKAADQTAEKVWELPLDEDYKEQIKSNIADVKNSGGRPGGTITAAKFLEMFVDKYPWAHLDIAAMDIESNGKPYIPKGGTGFGTRLLIQLVRDWVGK